jgi:hypothetical protein
MVGMIPEPKFDEIFKTAFFDDNEKKWAECNVPMGSEGSIHVEIWRNPNESHLAAYTITIFGDLRDHGDEKDGEAFKAWFKDVCKKLRIIRQAVVQFESYENNFVIYLTESDPDGNTFSTFKYERP